MIAHQHDAPTGRDPASADQYIRRVDNFKAHVFYGLRNVLQFQGRDAKQQFFPYLGFCILIFMVLTTLIMIPMTASSFLPGQTTEIDDIFGRFRQAVLLMAGGGAVFVAFIDAAVARRLRDAERSPWWGLLPLPFLSAGLYSMSQIDIGDESPELIYFPIAFVMNLAYLGALGALVWMLTRPTAYPPPPAPH